VDQVNREFMEQGLRDIGKFLNKWINGTLRGLVLQWRIQAQQYTAQHANLTDRYKDEKYHGKGRALVMIQTALRRFSHSAKHRSFANFLHNYEVSVADAEYEAAYTSQLMEMLHDTRQENRDGMLKVVIRQIHNFSLRSGFSRMRLNWVDDKMNAGELDRYRAAHDHSMKKQAAARMARTVNRMKKQRLQVCIQGLVANYTEAMALKTAMEWAALSRDTQAGGRKQSSLTTSMKFFFKLRRIFEHWTQEISQRAVSILLISCCKYSKTDVRTLKI